MKYGGRKHQGRKQHNGKRGRDAFFRHRRAPIPKHVQVLFSDEHLLAANKPSGLIATMAPGAKLSLQDMLRRQIKPSSVPDAIAPAAAHRLDRDTSGVILFARSERGAQGLARVFRENAVEKTYLLLCVGDIDLMEGEIDDPLEPCQGDETKMKIAAFDSPHAQEATTRYRVEKRFVEGRTGRVFTLVRAWIDHGRKHQIRVHFSSIGHPVAGDPRYGDKASNRLLRERAGLCRQFLHACTLSFSHPLSQKRLEIEAALPKDLSAVLHFLAGEERETQR